MVITGRTRNALALRGTWVRIPPTPFVCLACRYHYNFKKSSVSVAMKKLRESEHIIVSREGYITLTESGQAIADMIYERHTLLSSWLERLGVDPQVAADDACRMEHVISEESFNAIKKHIVSHS